MLHRIWQAAVAATLFTGLFHLLNLVGPGRLAIGPAMITPFRAAFAVAWIALLAGFAAGRRRPRLDDADLVVLAVVALYLLRAFFTPQTLGTSINWLVSGAGVFFLVKHGVRGKKDVKLIVLSLALAVVALGILGLGEYALKRNPLFDSIEIEAIGIDKRVSASSQFYRIRSLVGHPGFAGAIFVGAAPLVMLAFWRRRGVLAASLLVLAAALFFTFSRGSWFFALLVLAPVLFYRGRFWLRRNARWVAPAVLIPVLLVAIDYSRREEVSTRLGKRPVEEGLIWTKGKDGRYLVNSGIADGVQPYNKFLYFDVDDGFFHSERGAVTVVVHFFDRGAGAIHVDYDGWDESAGEEGGRYTPSGYINKTDTGRWTTAAFYLEDPRFAGRQNSGADFRIVDDDSTVIIDEVVVQKGKLKLPTVIAQQWFSRGGSLSTRAGLYPFAWSVIKDNPLGVGLFNTPGTDHHAVDSLPLTWLMEFGWLGVPLLGLILLALLREGFYAAKAKSGPAVVLYISLALLLLHGAHLMILYDKPSIVFLAAVAAIYALVRPWGSSGGIADVSNDDCML